MTKLIRVGTKFTEHILAENHLDLLNIFELWPRSLPSDAPLAPQAPIEYLARHYRALVAQDAAPSATCI